MLRHATTGTNGVDERAFSTLRNAERGGAIAELAVSLPILFFMLLGAVDFGRVWTITTRVASAAQAGAAYGAQSTSTATDSAGIRKVALHELGVDESSTSKQSFTATAATAGAAPTSDDKFASSSETPGQEYDVIVARYCECEDEEKIDCDKGTCVAGSGNRRVYVRVRVRTTFETLFDYPGIPSELVVARETQMRAR